MRVLIVENDLSTQKKLRRIFSAFGDCSFTADGIEAVKAYRLSWIKCQPYDLICMDIQVHNTDGPRILNGLREIEKEMAVKESEGVRVIITTSLDNPTVGLNENSRAEAVAYLCKSSPVNQSLEETCVLGLLE